MTPRLLYALFMLLALAAFLLARRCLGRRDPLARLPARTRAALALAAFAGGSLGAKAPFALVDPTGPWTLEAWASDGKTILAGLIGAYLAVEIAKRLLGVRTSTGDGYALPLALALAVGRWGCFCNGCCHGTATALPWGVLCVMPDPTGQPQPVRCHPTQVYESLFHFLLALMLAWLMGRRLLTGHLLKFYLIAYGAYRFLTEYIRPEPAVWLGLTIYQWASVLLMVGLGVQWWAQRNALPGSAGAWSDSRWQPVPASPHGGGDSVWLENF